MLRKFLRLVLLFAFCAAILFTSLPRTLNAQGGPTLVIGVPKKVDVGQPIKIKLKIKNASDIAGYELNVLFDGAAAHYSGSHQRDNALKKLGRDVIPLQVEQSTGGAAVGLASCAQNDCVRNTGAKQAHGGTGTFNLGFVFIGTDLAGPLEIKFEAPKFVDAAGRSVAVALSKSSVTVQVGSGGKAHPAPASRWQLSNTQRVAPEAGAMDVTGNKRVDFSDIMEVAIAWSDARVDRSPCADLPDPALDVNRDGCIDVADVQIVANRAQDFASAPSEAATQSTFTVNTTNDAADTTPGDGVCNATGGCTLRAAIDESNLSPGGDTINFNIPGGGVKTITLKTNLPTLSDTSGPITIDGYTQPGALPNTDPLASNAVILIQLAGTGPSSFDAFRISSSNNVVRGLAIYNVRRPFYIFGSGAANNRIVGNYIGTDAATNFFASTSVVNASGVHLENGPSNNHVGAPSPADRNIVSGNSRNGIATYYEATNNNFFQNNIIGLSRLGDRRVPNLSHGIDINSASSYNLVGGTGENERNVISGDGNPADTNFYAGVEISHDTSTVQNKVLGNCFGTDPGCNSGPAYAALSHYGIRLEEGVNNNEIAYNVIGNTKQGGINVDNYYAVNNWIHDNRVGISANGAAIPNPYFGIRVKYHAQHNRIGPNNIVANNSTGVIIEFNDEDYNTITQNSIYGNATLGIDLGPGIGVSYNDSGDTDTGANEGLNYPVITSATTTQVKGTGCGEAAIPKPCTIEIFIAQPDPNNSGGGLFGQGKTFVGTGTSNGSFTISLSGVSAGDLLTATSTDAQGNTSEFSKNFQVTAGQTPTPTIPPTNTPGPTVGASVTPTVQATLTPTVGPTSTPAATLTPTVGPTSTPAVTSTPTVGPTSTPNSTNTPAGPIVYAQDRFNRTLSNGWGTAKTGGAWSLSGTPSNFNVNGTDGTMQLTGSNVTRSAYLLTVSAQDVEATFRAKADKVAEGGAQIEYFVVRHINTNTHYLGRIRLPADGSIRIQAMAEVNGTQTALGGEKTLAGFTQSAGTYLNLKGQVIGTNPTTIRLKVWVEGQPEPANWLYTVTDSTPELQAPGGVGLRTFLATTATNAPVLYSFNNFDVISAP